MWLYKVKKGCRYLVVGGLPSPYGGVTNFLYRFCFYYGGLGIKLYDLYPGNRKIVPESINFYQGSGGVFKKFFCLFRVLFSFEGDKIFYNFSGPRSIIFTLFLPKRSSHDWCLLLHHGDLIGAYNKVPFIIRFIIRLGLKRFNRIACLSIEQKEFYDYMGVGRDLYFISSFLPAPEVDEEAVSSEVLSFIEINESREKRVVLASGYPTLIYNHDWVIDYAEQRDQVHLILCLYGPDSDNIKSKLLDRCSFLENVTVFWELASNDFQYLLRSCDVYARPNDVDSFGVAHAEALFLGKVVVASDACQRLPGTKTFSVGRKEYFFNELDEGILHRKLEKGSFSGSDVGLFAHKLEKFLDIK